jgi:hypothetical protein
MIHIVIIICPNEKIEILFTNFFNNVHNYIYIIHFKIYFLILLLTNISMTILWKTNANTLLVNGKTVVVKIWINKIYLSYFKHSFDLNFYIIQFLFQCIMILPITFHLNIWVHVIYPHKIFINGSYIYAFKILFILNMIYKFNLNILIHFIIIILLKIKILTNFLKL